MTRKLLQDDTTYISWIFEKKIGKSSIVSLPQCEWWWKHLFFRMQTMRKISLIDLDHELDHHIHHIPQLLFSEMWIVFFHPQGSSHPLWYSTTRSTFEFLNQVSHPLVLKELNEAAFLNQESLRQSTVDTGFSKFYTSPPGKNRVTDTAVVEKKQTLESWLVRNDKLSKKILEGYSPGRKQNCTSNRWLGGYWKKILNSIRNQHQRRFLGRSVWKNGSLPAWSLSKRRIFPWNPIQKPEWEEKQRRFFKK